VLPIQPDELTAAAASYDKTLRYGAQTPFNDQLASHWEGGKWEIDGTHDSIITAGNGGSKPTRTQVTLFFNGGSGKYQIAQTLAPDEQLWLDLGQLIRDQVPDKDGNILPASLNSGTYEFRGITGSGAGNIFEGKVITDKTYGHATYGCMICCGYPYGTAMWLDPLPLGVNFSSGQDVGSVNSCTGSTDPIGWQYQTWWTGNSSIAISPSIQQFEGMSLGSTGGLASGDINVGDGMTYVKMCPMQADQVSGTIFVNGITSITPKQVGQGRTSVTVKLGGTFSTNPHVSVSPAGISAGNVTVNSDGSLSVPFTIAQNAAIQSYTVTETDDGGSPSSIGFAIVCATPQNLSWPPPTPLNDGALAFNYSDTSSTSDPADLVACRVGETVFYPGINDPYVWPLPMVAATKNPAPRSGNGTNTAMPDTNFPPDSFQTPYSEAKFTATQRLWYICPCYNNGALTNFIPDFPIVRRVFLDNDNLWKYQIDKQGFSNKITLPNQ
jgi:hypothetical protein